MKLATLVQIQLPQPNYKGGGKLYEIIGIQRMDYENKNNRRVTGYKVFFSYDLPALGGENSGKAADSVFLSDSLFVQCGVAVGDAAMPIYNKYGRCTGFVESTE